LKFVLVWCKFATPVFSYCEH